VEQAKLAALDAVEGRVHWLGHRSIQHTVRYTELTATRFKDFWR
jgi:hypothetical protein